MYVLDSKKKTPLHIQLYNEIKKDIIKSYKIGDKLPSIRKVVASYNLSKTTVLNAYSQLVIEGYIDSKEKSSYIVIENNYENVKIEKKENIELEKKDEYLYDFYPARQEKDSFPTKLWKKLLNKSINENIDYCDLRDSRGELELRVEIAKYLNESRHLNTHSSEIIVCSGFVNSMSLLTKILKKTHNSLAIESPSYDFAQKVFEEQNYKIEKIALDKNGIILDELKKCKSKLLYLTPSHQFPTGACIPIKNRLEILKWAKQNNAFIIEDDYDSELSYYNRPVPSLQGLNSENRVIYLGTFSKSLSSSLRVSYMVMPKKLIDIYNTLSDSKDASVSLMIQNALCLFMKEGHWDKHQRKVRVLNKRKHNLTKKLLLEKLGENFRIDSQGVGLSILINSNKINFEKLKVLAKEQKLKLYFVDDVSKGEYNALRMGFGGIKEKDLPEAIEMFSRLWLLCLNK